MPDNDYNIIKPVESLRNIAGLTPAKRREERKRRQNLHAEHNEQDEQDEQEPNDSLENESPDNAAADNKNDRHSIDYCA